MHILVKYHCNVLINFTTCGYDLLLFILPIVIWGRVCCPQMSDSIENSEWALQRDKKKHLPGLKGNIQCVTVMVEISYMRGVNQRVREWERKQSSQESSSLEDVLCSISELHSFLLMCFNHQMFYSCRLILFCSCKWTQEAVLRVSSSQSLEASFIFITYS